MWCWVMWCLITFRHHGNKFTIDYITRHLIKSYHIQLHLVTFYDIMWHSNPSHYHWKPRRRRRSWKNGGENMHLVNMQISTTIFPCTSSLSRFLMIVCSDNKHVTWCHEMSWGHVTWCHEMSCDVVKMSCNVTWCYENVIECYVML